MSVSGDSCDTHTKLPRGKTPVFRLLKLWDTFAMTQGRVCLSTHTQRTIKTAICMTLQQHTHTYQNTRSCLNSYRYGCEDVLMYVVLLAMLLTFPRPNLDLPRGFSCYWRDAHPSCRLLASHTSTDIGCDNHPFHVKHKPYHTSDVFKKSAVKTDASAVVPMNGNTNPDISSHVQ